MIENGDPTHGRRLNVLLLEDRDDDAEFIAYELRQAGLDVILQRVETEQEYCRQLSPDVDVILADYSLPQFDALSALDLLKEKRLDIPFIVVSGTIGEEAAVETLTHGAVDYLLKDRLGRLGEAVKAALQARALRCEQQDTMRALARSEERYRKLVDQSLQGIVVAQDGRTVFCNQAYADMMGYTVEELLDMSSREIAACIHPDDRARVLGYHRRRVAGDATPARYEFRVIRKDGAVRWQDALVTRATFQGRPAAQAYYVDVTERKQQEERARRQQTRERVEAILDAIGDGVLVLDRLGHVEQANPAFEQQTGYRVREISGQHYRKLLTAAPDVDEGKIRCALAVVLRGNPWRGEATLLRRDGSSFDAALTITAMRDGDNRIYAFVVSIRDISKMKEVERMKDSILSIAAHELRTPLTTIRLYSESLATRGPDLEAERRQKYSDAILRQTLHLQEILDNMLDLARLEAGRGLELNAEPIDVRVLVDEVVQPFAETADRHTFELDTASIRQQVRGDRLRLAQLLRNIISNAIKYSPDGGLVTVRGEDGDAQVQISVADRGIGIAPDQQGRLFEKFYRADSSSNAARGTGLGLAICRLIVEGHGGRIWVESEPGKGSTFTVCLPTADSPHHSPPASGNTGM